MSRQAGYIYILKHQNGQTVKVGETSVSPQSRLEGYSEAYQLQGFSIYKTFKVPLNSRQDIEKRTHAKLKQDRLSGIAGAREIFACTPHKAETAVEDAISESEIFIIELEKQLEQEKIRAEEEKLKKEREDLLNLYRENIQKEWEDSEKFKILNNQLLEIKKSHPNYGRLPFIYWFFGFVFAFNSIFYIINVR